MLTSKSFIEAFFDYISFQNVIFQCRRLEKNQYSMYISLIKDISCGHYYLLSKFTNFLRYFCERIILITPIAFLKLNIRIIRIKCSLIMTIAHILFAIYRYI